MSKTLLDFEGKLFSLSDIKIIERGEEWDVDELRMSYTIIINNPAHDDAPFLRRLKFPFPTMDKRDIAWNDLRDKLEELEVTFI